MKNKYFVNIVDGIISEKSGDNATFTIYAEESELRKIREKLENMDDASRATYVKSHIPYYPADESPDNKEYDANLKELYTLLHDFGDTETRNHIESLGIMEEPGDHLV